MDLGKGSIPLTHVGIRNHEYTVGTDWGWAPPVWSGLEGQPSRVGQQLEKLGWGTVMSTVILSTGKSAAAPRYTGRTFEQSLKCSSHAGEALRHAANDVTAISLVCTGSVRPGDIYIQRDTLQCTWMLAFHNVFIITLILEFYLKYSNSIVILKDPVEFFSFFFVLFLEKKLLSSTSDTFAWHFHERKSSDMLLKSTPFLF